MTPSRQSQEMPGGHRGVRDFRYENSQHGEVALGILIERQVHPKNAKWVVDRHGLIHEAIVAHGERVIDEVAHRKDHAFSLEYRVHCTTLWRIHVDKMVCTIYYATARME